MSKKLTIGILAVVTVCLFGYTRTKLVPPSDLRDAVADEMQAPELNTDVHAVVETKVDVPVPVAAAVEKKPAMAEEPPSVPLPPHNPLDNFGVVSWQDSTDRGGLREGVVYRGGSLDSEAHYAYLQAIGVTAVVNLQSSHPSPGNVRAAGLASEDSLIQPAAGPNLCTKYGLNCRDFGIFPFDMFSLTGSSAFQDAFRFLVEERKAGHKIYIHCMKGKDRTGALAAAFMIRERACGRDFDKDKLRAEIEASLKKHRFWASYYVKWHPEIIGWVDNFEGNKKWICK